MMTSGQLGVSMTANRDAVSSELEPPGPSRAEFESLQREVAELREQRAAQAAAFDGLREEVRALSQQRPLREEVRALPQQPPPSAAESSEIQGFFSTCGVEMARLTSVVESSMVEACVTYLLTCGTWYPSRRTDR